MSHHGQSSQSFASSESLQQLGVAHHQRTLAQWANNSSQNGIKQASFGI